MTLLGLCLVSALTAEAAPDPVEPAGLPVLTTIAEVHTLSPALARSNCPVRLTATVLYCDLEWRILFIRDGASMTFVLADTLSVEPKSGDAIALQAVTAEKNGGVFMANPEARILGKGTLPEPKNVTVTDLQNAGGQWVETEGVVQSADDTSRRLAITACGQGGRFEVVVKDYAQAAFRNLVDARIRFRGVCSAPQRPGEPCTIFVPGMTNTTVLQPAPASPFSLPITAAADAPDASSPNYDGHRIRIRGTVVRQQLGKSLELAEAGGASIELRTPQLTPVAVGEPVEAVGFPLRTESSLLLENALFRSPEDESGADPSLNPHAGSVASAPLPAPLRRVDQVRQLPPEQVDRGLPVKLDAVVTFYEPDGDVLYIEDGTGGLRVRLGARRYPVAPSQRVEISGVTEAGTPTPQILASRIVNLGDHLLPPGRSTSWDRLSSGKEDGEWVEVRGTIRSVSRGSGRVQFNIATARDRCQMEVLHHDAEAVPANLVGAAVRTRAVCRAILDDRRRLTGLRLLVPWLDEIKVEEAAPDDLFTLPLRSIASLYALDSQETAGRPIHLQGQVTLHKPGQFFYVQDHSAAVRVEWAAAQSLQPGQRVDVTGYEAEQGLLPVVEEASVRLLDPVPLAPPQNITVHQILEGGLHGQRIALEARLLDQVETPEGMMLVLQADDLVFNAHGVGEPAAVARRWEPGSTLRLSGVCVLAMRDWRRVQAFRLLLGSANDVQLLTRPPRWTLERLGRMLGVALLVLLVLAVWAVSVSRRNTRLREEIRERERAEEALRQARDHLEERVVERTAELVAANTSLQEQAAELQRAQDETLQRSRELAEANARLEREVQERRETQAKLTEVLEEMMVVSRKAGMAEIATGVLHNVGNVLNSVNVSGGLITDGIKHSKVASLSRLAALFREHADDLGAFLTHDPRGRQIPPYLEQLAHHLARERERLAAEMTSLLKNIDHIKQVVAKQQDYARASGVLEHIPAVELVEDALSIQSDAFARQDIRLVREYRDAPTVLVDKHKVLQVLINLFSNAQRACDDGPASSKEVVVRVALTDSDEVSIQVADNGVGIPAGNLSRIFRHGFTTRAGGHGFGLHSSALAANELGGSLKAHSPGPGQGATFTLTLPLAGGQELTIPHHTAFLRRSTVLCRPGA